VELVTHIGLFAAVVATWVAVTGPGEAALVGAGSVAARGEEEIGAVLAIAFAGTLAGSFAAYWLGRAGGRRLFLRPGPLLGARTRALARSEGIAQRHRFLASLLTPGWFAGVNQIPLRPFVLGSGLSGLAWTLTVGLGAFYVGPSLIAQFDTVGQWMTVAAAVAVGVGLILLRRSRRRPSRIGAGQHRQLG
jgi:membrane protein DedA with SNARE-associated domain